MVSISGLSEELQQERERIAEKLRAVIDCDPEEKFFSLRAELDEFDEEHDVDEEERNF